MLRAARYRGGIRPTTDPILAMYRKGQTEMAIASLRKYGSPRLVSMISRAMASDDLDMIFDALNLTKTMALRLH